MSHTYIHLGRNGDVINTLPLLHHIAQTHGPVHQVVSAKYASVLDGVSYVKPVVFGGEFAALRDAMSAHPDAINLQVYGRGMNIPRRASSFVLEQWERAGMAHLWGTLPLVFDRRNARRERELVRRVRTGTRPMVLVAVAGESSPFPHGERLLQMIAQRVGDMAQVVDLRHVQAHRIYDLLGLYDSAACLVTIDTAHQHLAHGSEVPVIALSTSGPTPWHSSPRRPGHIMHLKYHEYPWAEAALVDQVAACVGAGVSKPKPTAPRPRRIIHTYPGRTAPGPAEQRHRNAVATWPTLSHWTRAPYVPEDGQRNAKDLGDHRDLPYMRDLIAHAMALATTDDDVILVTNGDVGLVNCIDALLQDALNTYGACYTHRWDFHDPIVPMGPTDVRRGTWYPGSDAFAFTVGWWKAHGHRYPDMLIGAEYVDCLLRQLIKQVCGKDAEVHLAVFHQYHESYWETHRNNPANRHNAALAADWFRAHQCDDLDPFGPGQADRIRAKRRRPIYHTAP